MIEIKDKETFDNELNMNHENNIISLLYYTAKWCGPCQNIYPKLLDLENNEKYKDIKIYKLDVDIEEITDIITQYKIKSIPAFFTIKNKEIHEKCVGSDIENIISILDKTIN